MDWFSKVLLIVVPLAGIGLSIVALTAKDTTISKGIKCIFPHNMPRGLNPYIYEECLEQTSKARPENTRFDIDDSLIIKNNLLIEENQPRLKELIPYVIFFQCILMVLPLAALPLLSQCYLDPLSSLALLRNISVSKKKDILEDSPRALGSTALDYLSSFCVVFWKCSIMCLFIALYTYNGNYLGTLYKNTGTSTESFLGIPQPDGSLVPVVTVNSSHTHDTVTISDLNPRLAHGLQESDVSFEDKFMCIVKVRRLGNNYQTYALQCMLSQLVTPSRKPVILIVFQALLSVSLVLSVLGFASIFLTWLWSMTSIAKSQVIKHVIKPKQLVVGQWSEMQFQRFLKLHVSADVVFKLILLQRSGRVTESHTEGLFELWQNFSGDIETGHDLREIKS